jgi:hypothetical protein
MKTRSVVLLVALMVGASGAALSQQPKQDIYVAPNAPKDKPVDVGASQVQQFEAAIKPYIEKARSTYPQARARFLNGLPPKHTFFVTTRIRDAAKRFEQVFVAVREIKEGTITGVLASEIHVVSGYSAGDVLTFPESELIDWTISKPDGTEEGNFVGNFLDTYQPAAQPTAEPIADSGVWKKQPVTPAHVNERIEKAAVEYASRAPIPRIVLYDIGYPKDEKEYTALDGQAVILFTAVSQIREELPLQKAYAVVEGEEVELKLLKVVLAELPTTDSATAKTFGRFRADALYLLPMSLRARNPDILVNFQKNRTAFKVAALATPLPDDLNRMMSVKPSGAGPSQDALEAFIKREYPSFFQ